MESVLAVAWVASHKANFDAKMMTQKSSIGCKSREHGGQSINFSPRIPKEAKNAFVAQAEWEGALSCLNIKFQRNKRDRSSIHGINESFKMLR